MAWVETITLKSGEKRYRVAERAPDGRLVKGPTMGSLRDAERLAGRTGIERERDELGLVKRDYPIAALLDELPGRLFAEVSESYIERYGTVAKHLRRFLRTHAPGITTLSQLTKAVLLDYRRFRLRDGRRGGARSPGPVAPDGPELTAVQAAALLGYTRAATLRLLHEGLLEGRKVADGRRLPYYLIRRTSLDAFRETPRYARGRKRAEANARRRADGQAAAKPVRGVRNRTVNVEISMIQSLLNKAVDWGLLEDTPVRSTRGLLLPEGDSVPFRALTEAEFDRFHRVCPSWLLPPLMTAALLGLREGEIRQLEWSDVDLEAWTVRIGSKEGFRLKSQGRTGVHEYRMDVPQQLRGLLSELSLQREGFDDDFVFHNTKGRPLGRGGLRKRFAHVMKTCGITDVKQVHALRHTFVTHMARRVDNLYLLKDLARHKDIRTTSRYVDVFDEDKRRALTDFTIGSTAASRATPDAPKSSGSGSKKRRASR